MKIKKNESLAKHTSFKVGGKAKYFCEPSNINEILEALEFSKSKKIKYFVLGKGSNVIFPDKGFNGLIIRLKTDTISVEGRTVFAYSGVPISKLLAFLASRGLSGLEFLAGIPGTLGGAVYMNAGQKEKSISSSLLKVVAMKNTGKIITIGKESCKFGYRKSLFQNDKYIILGAFFMLKKRSPAKIKKEISSIIKEKTNKQPYDYPSAGSIFKNPKTIPAWKLIEKLGFKGKSVGGAMVSKKHANFIINKKNAKGSDIKSLIKMIQKEALKKYKIKLIPEVNFLE